MNSFERRIKYFAVLRDAACMAHVQAVQLDSFRDCIM